MDNFGLADIFNTIKGIVGAIFLDLKIDLAKLMVACWTLFTGHVLYRWRILVKSTQEATFMLDDTILVLVALYSLHLFLVLNTNLRGMVVHGSRVGALLKDSSCLRSTSTLFVDVTLASDRL